MKYNWNWQIFWDPAPDGTGIYLSWLISGLGWTIATALAACIIALVLGATIGTLDRKSTRLNSSHMSESRMPSSA